MRERNIVFEIAIILLMVLLVVINGLTLLQNQSIEKRLITMEASATKRGESRGEAPGYERRTPIETVQSNTPRSPSYYDGSTMPIWPRGDENATDGDTLTINEVMEPNSWNYLIENDATVHDIWELTNCFLAKRNFGHPNAWEPELAQAWESAMVCRGLARNKNAPELAAKLNAALSGADRDKMKIAKIVAESDEVLRIELSDAVGEYRKPVLKALGDGAIEPQHWLFVSYEGEKFTDGTPVDAKSVAKRVRAAIQASPTFKGRFLPDWEREGSVAILIAGDESGVEQTVKAFVASDGAKGEATEAKSVTGKITKQVLTYDSLEHYSFEEKPIYTFFIRKGVRWHDGEPFTGKDVVFSYNTMMNPQVEAPVQRNGYVDCESCKLVDGDPYTVQFVWKKPYFLSFASSCEVVLVPEHSRHFADGSEFNKDAKNQHFMGTGPYKEERIVKGSEVVLVRNEDYWGKKPHFTHLKVKFIKDSTSGFLSLKNGDIDVQGLTKQQAHDNEHNPEFRSKFNLEISVAPTYRYVGWNIRHEMFSTVKTRRALTMLIDRQRIVEKINYGYAELLDVPSHPESPAFPKNAAELRIPFDVEGAKKLLKEDGWADLDGDRVLDKEFNGKRIPFKFTLLIVSGSPEYEAIANQMKDAFAQAGIAMTIRNLEWSVFLQNVERLNYDAMILGWQVTVADDPFQLWHSSQTVEKASNHCGYVNKQVDQWIEEGRKELDTEKRCEIFAKVYTQITLDQPYTCLFVAKRTTAYDKRIRNVVYNFQTRDFTRWWVPKELQKEK